jgi:hypothetical protein
MSMRQIKKPHEDFGTAIAAKAAMDFPVSRRRHSEGTNTLTKNASLHSPLPTSRLTTGGQSQGGGKPAMLLLLFASLGLGCPDCRLYHIEQIAFCAEFRNRNATAFCLLLMLREGKLLLVLPDRNRFSDFVFQDFQTLD